MTKPNRTAGARASSGANLLITAGALAATLGGWYVLANAEQPAAQSGGVPAAQAELAPVPTLVPPPDIGALPAQPAPPAAGRSLRSVSRPAPVARTRSSR